MTIPLTFHAPSDCFNETKWIVYVLLKEFLGIPYHIVKYEGTDFYIKYKGKKLQLRNFFLKNASKNWLQPSSLPEFPLPTLDVSSSGLDLPLLPKHLPILFGTSEIDLNKDSIVLGIDIIGTVFFMLSRYEEVTLPGRDSHDRFPATLSLAYKAGFLDRPIVDEYVEFFWACIKRLWPNLTRKKNIGKTNISCDVDRPFDCTVENLKILLRTTGGDIVKRRTLTGALKRLNRYCFNKIGTFRFDDNYTFDWYMDTCEKNGLTVTFYFISDNSEPNNGGYSLEEKRIISLIENIYRRGHNIGLHGSYNTYKDAQKIRAELQNLQSLCDKITDIKIKNNRQHYLRWDSAQTPDHLDAAGFDYDSTGGYADHPGFRYGTSKQFTMWSWKKNSQLRIKQIPLIVMECSVISDSYLGFGHTDAAYELMLKLKERSHKYGGTFTLLWHNSELTTQADKKLFKRMLK